jgi:hypothetical protein
MILQDGPIIQLFVCASLQIADIVIIQYLKPFDSRNSNLEAVFFSSVTSILMLSCGIYVFEDVRESHKLNAMKFFIFTFVGMMTIIILQVLYQGVSYLIKKIRGKKKGNDVEKDPE